MPRAHLNFVLCLGVILAPVCGHAQIPSSSAAQLKLQISLSPHGKHATPAVVWLESAPGTATPPFLPHGHYTLLQKNRMFLPHLQVVPVGTAVQFPNADPFFHNVFSLFDGKRFDLGLYEAGSSKSVTFSRQGVSYVFCNIHPEMSAVVLALSTPLYAVADGNNAVLLSNVPAGDYFLHLWIEGIPQPVLESLTRSIHVASPNLDLGVLTVPTTPIQDNSHSNKFGKEYAPSAKSPYEPNR